MDCMSTTLSFVRNKKWLRNEMSSSFTNWTLCVVRINTFFLTQVASSPSSSAFAISCGSIFVLYCTQYETLHSGRSHLAFNPYAIMLQFLFHFVDDLSGLSPGVSHKTISICTISCEQTKITGYICIIAVNSAKTDMWAESNERYLCVICVMCECVVAMAINLNAFEKSIDWIQNFCVWHTPKNWTHAKREVTHCK